MNKKLYNMMDWAAVEEVVYAECDHPQDYLGAHTVGNQTMVQAFFPDAKAVTLYIDGVDGPKGKTVKNEIKMDLMDDAGFFAALIPGKNRKDYKYYVQYSEKGKRPRQFVDPYNYTCLLKEADAEKYNLGTLDKTYEVLGAHLTTVGGIRGCIFRVWAPYAMRVSVVGDFNEWNEKVHQMVRLYDSGIFELFVPGVEANAKYKYDILLRGGISSMKTDPYSVMQELRPDCACIINNLKGYKWKDDSWLKERKNRDYHKEAFYLYECNLAEYMENVDSLSVAADHLIKHVKKMGYTHVSLMPIMEYALDETEGFQTSLYYATTSRYGEPEDYKLFIDKLHQEKIGVILQWTANCFSPAEDGLARYDGTGLYEHEDARKGVDPRNGMRLFNYNRPEVASYLLDNALFWIREYHVDGLMLCDVASMLFLDYYRAPGQWIPNIYGGNENLESIEFIKKLNQLVHKQEPGVLMLAEDESGYPGITVSKNANGLGFDFTSNHGWNQDILNYLSFDPIERKAHHHELTMSMIYQYNESYILPICHNNVNFGKGMLVDQMPGNRIAQVNNVKALYGYMITHPGKKQMFMGQDKLLEEGQAGFAAYVKDLNHFYLSHPALYEMDETEDGFEWINSISANENVISFVRYDKNKADWLLVVINMANTSYDKYKIGVPAMGRYKEVLASDDEIYGGTGIVNARMIASKEEECDGRVNSIRISLAPLSISIFEFHPYTEKELQEMEKRRIEKEKKRLENEKKRQMLAKEKAKIRASLKEELAKKIADAEAQIEKEMASGKKPSRK